MFFNKKEKYYDVEFSVTGIINDEEETINYKYEKNKGSVNGGEMSMIMFNNALERKTQVGPVGMYLNRDVNNPLAVLSILTSDEIFQSVIRVEKISGVMPEAPSGSDNTII